MSVLPTLLLEEAKNRGLVSRDQDLDPGTAFALVRDMPYRRASTREPETIIREWRGTCSGKHYLLHDVFEEMGLDSRIIMCTHRFTQDNTTHFPAELRKVIAHGPVPDVHTYLRLKTDQGWMTVDATWPSKAAALGMPVNRDFQEGQDMTVACDPIITYEAPPDQDPQQFKEDLIESFCGAIADERDEFIEGLGRWLGDSTA